MSLADAPITFEEFSNYIESLGPFGDRPKFAVAVSGGADSLALTLLAQEWVNKSGGEVLAVTVDHGLRAESKEEAAQVGKWLKKYNISHHILKWSPPENLKSSQALARNARYLLLKDWCADQGIRYLLLGHHAQDQAETVMMRFNRGSGVDGLAGMSCMVEGEKISMLRPLLRVYPGRLKATLKARNQDWVEDPTNQLLKYERNRIRKELTHEECQNLNMVALKAGVARSYLEKQAQSTLSECTRLFSVGYAHLNIQMFADLDQEMKQRVFKALVVAIGGHIYPPRFEKITNAVERLEEHSELKPFTTCGCYVMPKKAYLVICREFSAVDEILDLRKIEGQVRWDQRFVLDQQKVLKPTGLVIQKIGADKWAQLPENIKVSEGCEVPSYIGHALPALWKKDEIIAIPHLNYDPNQVLEGNPLLFSPPIPLYKPAFHVKKDISSILNVM